jgi:3-oxoacyl-[acyl-carrier-protein] synthase III
VKVFVPATLGVGIRLSGTGAYLPKRVVTNAELVAGGAPMTEEEIVRLSGIVTRHFADSSEATSDLAVNAARSALERSGVPADQIERLVLATVSADHQSPSAACIVQRALGLPLIPAFDVTASCSGFLYALDAAARAVATGEQHVLAIAADVRSRFLNPADRATFALFGDGAGAAVVSRGEHGKGLVAIGLSADGSGAKSVYVPAGGSREPASAETVAAKRHSIHMAEGAQVYLSAVEGMLAVGEELLKSQGLTFADVDLIVPHQPNRRILDRLAKIGRFDAAKLFINVDRIGNVSGASIAIALDEVLRGGVKPGAKVLLIAAGAGYTAGAALIQL